MTIKHKTKLTSAKFQSNEAMLTVRVPAELLNRLTKQAALKGATRSVYIRAILSGIKTA